MEKKILDLPLIGKWYEMTESGVKKEEYREIKPYWIKRMFKASYGCCLDFVSITQDKAEYFTRYPHELKQRCDVGRLQFRYTHIRIRYGYTWRTLLKEVESVRIGRGNKALGAPDKDVIIIKYKD